jgi:hypothetical protein
MPDLLCYRPACIHQLLSFAVVTEPDRHHSYRSPQLDTILNQLQPQPISKVHVTLILLSPPFFIYSPFLASFPFLKWEKVNRFYTNIFNSKIDINVIITIYEYYVRLRFLYPQTILYGLFYDAVSTWTDLDYSPIAEMAKLYEHRSRICCSNKRWMGEPNIIRGNFNFFMLYTWILFSIKGNTVKLNPEHLLER